MSLFRTTLTVVLTIEHLFVSFQNELKQVINIGIYLHIALNRDVFLAQVSLWTDVNNWLQKLLVRDMVSSESHPSAAQSRCLNYPCFLRSDCISQKGGFLLRRSPVGNGTICLRQLILKFLLLFLHLDSSCELHPITKLQGSSVRISSITLTKLWRPQLGFWFALKVFFS